MSLLVHHSSKDKVPSVAAELIVFVLIMNTGSAAAPLLAPCEQRNLTLI